MRKNFNRAIPRKLCQLAGGGFLCGMRGQCGKVRGTAWSGLGLCNEVPRCGTQEKRTGKAGRRRNLRGTTESARHILHFLE
jgi:hypothetical protein